MSAPAQLGNISPLIPGGKDLAVAIAFYEQRLGFQTLHREGNPLRLAIVQRDQAQLYLCQQDYQPLSNQLSLRIQVHQIDQLYAEYCNKDPSIIHPEGHLALKPWGPKEFVVIDPEGVCLTFYEIP
ncbi:MAG: VOC family protein [Acaryochloridaceae cyanobacterium SU_2_1]|nr:VOC family protein [Acaryochloridaceae cyanobacterium SU_2_1]